MHTTKLLAAGVLVATAALGAGALAPAQAHQPVTSSAERAGSFTVTASVNDDEPVEGDKVKIKGLVKPAAPGAQVRLQVKYEDQKKWKTIDTTTLSRTSKYKFKDKVGSVRERKYRVLKPAGAHRAAGRSPAVKVTVFGWRDLTSVPEVAAQGTFFSGTATMNGVTYPRSLVTTLMPGSVSYNLNRDCRTLEATYGLDDRSPSGSTATLSLTADSVLKYAGTFGLTQSQSATTNLTGVFRITLDFSNTGNGVGGVGTPRVLCSF